jgi:hypothetical protein
MPRLVWPESCPVSADEAMGKVWEFIQTRPSTKPACGYVAHELGIDPVFLLRRPDVGRQGDDGTEFTTHDLCWPAHCISRQTRRYEQRHFEFICRANDSVGSLPHPVQVDAVSVWAPQQ